MIFSCRGLAAAVALGVCAATARAQQPSLPPSRPGFPVTLAGSGPVSSQIAVADLDGDGTKEIVFGTFRSDTSPPLRQLWVVNANGTVRPGWPQTVPAQITGSPAIGQVDGVGDLDIVVGFKSTTDPTGKGGMRAYRSNGTMIWERLTFTDQADDGVFSTPAIGNVDGAAGNEVVFGSFDMRIYVVHGTDGTDLPGWPVFVRDTIFSSPALADLNGDGKAEIIIGCDTHAEGPPYNTPNGGALHVFTSDAREMPGFPKFTDQTTMSSPAVGDIDGDGNPEIVVGGGVFYTGSVGRKVYAYHCDGSTVAGWPVTVDNQVFSSPALADVDGDRVLDVVISDEPGSSGTPPHVYAFKGTGAQIFKTVAKSFFGTSQNAAVPIVADVTGDGLPEILVAVNTEIAVLSRTGAQLTDPGVHDGRKSYFMPTTTPGAVVTHLDGTSGTVDVVAGTGTPFPSGVNGQIYVFNPAAFSASPNAYPWPAFHQDPSSRRGVAPGTGSCAPPAPQTFFTVTPCRVVDTRSAPGALGGPAMAAMATRDFPVAGACGIPASAKAVALNVTVTGDTNYGDLRLFPTGTPGGSSSTINWRAGQTRANNAIIPLGAGGQVSVWCVMPGGGVSNVILDVFGYFQ